ncbi:hybrid sensor histidine kinase/response regulator [Roseimaritima sediminicola]|uniref:hybrid sensor histidine kinase/response regulator n=1 Tax=Roseimaritima sediminicola TaxID=2662066 RepID=UPI0012984E96|nr:response regulator [Roseimaritima sediminicola]
MNNQELAKLLMATFLEELHEHTGCLGRELLAMEKPQSDQQRQESINQMFRAAHSLKGAAAVVSAEPIRTACHVMEDFFSELRDGQRDLDESMTSTMLKTVDAIEEAAGRLRSEKPLEEAPLQQMIPVLRRAADEGRASDEERATDEARATDAAAESATTSRRVPRAGIGAEELEEQAASPDGAPLEVSSGSPADAADRATTEAGVTATAAPSPPAPRGEGHATVRVAAEKLDTLLAHSGELLVARGRFAYRAEDANELRETASELRKRWRKSHALVRQTLAAADAASEDHQLVQRSERFLAETEQMIGRLTTRLEKLAGGIEADNRHLSQTCELLDDEIYNVRMLPFASACIGLERIVRDIAGSSDKKVHLDLADVEVEVDRSVLEGLKDPLIHLVRNAVDHGIEPIQQRCQRGKPPEATVRVAARLCGGQVEVVVEDDGRGFDLERICETARRRGFEIPADPREQARLVFAPGFSTATMITDISGRGVGLDVVQNQVESLHGAVDVAFQPGQGTRFTLVVPLTLTTIRAMLVSVGAQLFALPTPSVEQVVRFDYQDIKAVGGSDVLILNQTPTPLVSLASTLGVEAHSGRPGKRLAVVLSAGEQRVAAVVEDVRCEQEVLVKSLGSRIRRLKHFSGCTLLPSGRIALVVNVTNVIRTALGMKTRYIASNEAPEPQGASLRVLVVEDSVTTRTLMKNILETAGYEVDSAVDGQEAVEKLDQHTYDVVVSDIDMPRMDGFTLTEWIRQREDLAELPVVLVTARGSDEDKTRGIHVGANAYIIKGTFEQQNLLETVGQLV